MELVGMEPHRCARQLRRNGTEAERKLWSRLRDRQLGGFKFVRQEPVGPYYVDFICREQKLIVEVDGGQHAESAGDRQRDAELRTLGYRVVPVWDKEDFVYVHGRRE